MCHVVKIGGSTLSNLQSPFFDALKNRIEQGEKIVIVHGGGPEINKKLTESGLPLEMKNGVRVTSLESLFCVKTALNDITNTNLVERLKNEGISAQGLCGAENSLLTCDFLDKENYGWVGSVERVNTDFIQNVLEAGKVPVIASLGVTENGETVNINADTAAGETAAALSAESICFVTDTPGVSVLGEWKKCLTISDILKSIVEGHISGGMVPKVEAAIKCLDLNIKQVRITDQTLSGTELLKEVLIT